ncbi:Ubiquitin-conjugating enzyme E2 T [Operophtera brumata]|uniref:Ubiquitin-conjugating enzyme E2 T n=1 Tax=Operophtera brumata TaxID=104452 RepID=A0A0L7LHY2_OPEBR|nr:Ubiquitin-conjugating enzyme E2 T [Operophtera brumata]
MSSGARTARLARELKNFNTKPPWGITCHPEKEDVYDALVVTLLGPKGSPYENGSFKLNVTIPEKSLTLIPGGRICMDMLKMPPKGAWLPTITLETLLVSLQTLLANPNPDDPLMTEIANEYKFDIESYLVNAKKHTEQYAS